MGYQYRFLANHFAVAHPQGGQCSGMGVLAVAAQSQARQSMW